MEDFNQSTSHPWGSDPAEGEEYSQLRASLSDLIHDYKQGIERARSTLSRARRLNHPGHVIEPVVSRVRRAISELLRSAHALRRLEANLRAEDRGMPARW